MSKKVTIGMLLDGKYPSDIRVRKEAESLVNDGFKVIVICPSTKKTSMQEEHNGVIIERIGSHYTFNKKGILDIITSINYVHPWFKKYTPALIEKHNITHLHVHDLPLAKTALLLKKRYGTRVILDLHENYPEGLKTWFEWKKSIIKRIKNSLFFSYSRWMKFEKKMCHQVDMIIAVVDEMKSRLVEIHNVPEEKIVVVSNMELKSFKDQKYVEDNLKIFKGRFVLTYVGGFGPHRGLDTAIKAMPYIKEAIPNSLLLLIGSGSKDVIDTLNGLINDLQLEDCITNLHQQPFSTVWGFVHNANINIIPHHSNAHTDNTIPHKLFQILSSQKPILVSSCKPLERIINEHNAGTVFEAGNPKDFADKVIQIKEDYDKALIKAKNGYDAVTIKNLNWESDAKILSKIYQRANG